MNPNRDEYLRAVGVTEPPRTSAPMLELFGDDRALLLKSIDLHERTLKGFVEMAEANDDPDDIPDLNARRQKLIDLAARVRNA